MSSYRRRHCSFFFAKTLPSPTVVIHFSEQLAMNAVKYGNHEILNAFRED